MLDVTKMQKMTKQQVLDKSPESNEETALQNLLFSFSKTKLEQTRRVLNEVNSIILYKTQLRNLPFIEVLNALNVAVSLNQQGDGK